MVYAEGWEWVCKRIYAYSAICPVLVGQVHFMVVIHKGEGMTTQGKHDQAWAAFCEKVLRQLSSHVELDTKPTRNMLRKSFGQGYFLDVCFVSPPPVDGKIFEELWSEFEVYLAGGWRSWKVWLARLWN